MRVEASLDYLPGARNDLADGLSRDYDSALSAVRADRRLRVCIREIADVSTGARLWPAGEPVPLALSPLVHRHGARDGV